MELQMQSHEWHRRRPDWAAAVCAGLVGGAVLMLLELLWWTTDPLASPWRSSHLVAAIVLGPGVLQSDGFALPVVGVALLTHYVLGMVFGALLAVIIAGFRYESSAGMLEVIGLVFGAALYLLNFYGMSALFPWMAEMRGWSAFIGHLVFGMTMALIYPVLRRRRQAEA
jgi:hypothetical protein